MPLKIQLQTQLTGILLAVCLGSPSLMAEGKSMPVTVAVARQDVIREELPLTGNIRSIRRVGLSSEEEGYVTLMNVDVGDYVAAGDVVLALNDELARIEIQRVKARMLEAKARLKEFIRQRDEAEKLVGKKHIAATSFEAASAQVEIQQTVLKQLQAELHLNQAIVERHSIKAPFAGVVSEKFVEEGQWIETNTAIVQLIELDPLRVFVNVPQFYYSRIKQGMKVNIRYDAIPDQTFSAAITRVVPVSETNNRTFPIFIDIDNPDGFIAPGMSARVMIQLHDDKSQQLLVIPRDAIVQKPDGEKNVWVVREADGKQKVEPVIVETGSQSGSFISITSGELQSGDRVVVKGNELLRSGQDVNVIQVQSRGS